MITELNFTLLSAGYCTHPERVTIKGGSWCSQKYPALCALIQHPKYGNILFDTGYSQHFFDETKKWPYSLYKKITPVKILEEQTLRHQLSNQGINSNQISYIILSHFHADHIAGIKDFPNAKIICSREGFDAVKNKNGFSALRKGYLGGLLPNDFGSRSIFIEDQRNVLLDKMMNPFTKGIDIFNDDSLTAVFLPGHAIGQIGLIFKDNNDKQVFLVADSCWSSKAYREYKLPSAITYLIHDKRSEYQDTLFKLHTLYNNNKEIQIIPSHCQEIWQQISEKKSA